MHQTGATHPCFCCWPFVYPKVSRYHAGPNYLGKWASCYFYNVSCASIILAYLIGQNHLRSTDAHIFAMDLHVYFAAPSMNFFVTCYDSSALAAFPSLKPPQPSSCSAANVTCLLTPFPVPEGNTPIRLSRGLNIHTVCLLLRSSFLNSPLFSGPLWLEGNKLSHGLQPVSSPIDLSCITQNSRIGHPQALFTANHHNYSKFRPSRPIMPMDSVHPTLFATTSQSDSGVDFSISSGFTTNILIHSQMGNASIFHDLLTVRKS